MARRRISNKAGFDALLAAGQDPQLATNAPETFATAVRFLLEELAERVPGNSVEVRVPPLGATQCIEGPRHTRGTPPNVVEMTPEVWLALATGKIHWDAATAAGQIHASGVRASLAEVLPLIRL